MITVDQAQLQAVTRFADNLLANYGKLDIDQDGYLSSKDLNRYKENIISKWTLLSEEIHPSEAQTIAHIDVALANLRYFSDSKNDEWGRETTGITRKDLETLAMNARNPVDGQPSANLPNLATIIKNQEDIAKETFEQVLRARELDKNLILQSPAAIKPPSSPAPDSIKEPVSMPNAADRPQTKMSGC